MARGLKKGDRVKMTDQLHKYDFGTGVIVDKRQYVGGFVCYLVKSDENGKVWDYSPSQLTKIR